jgi:hypothetical protein
MQSTTRSVNPFALLTDPEVVMRQVHGSRRLLKLHRRVCRPLDRLVGMPSTIVELGPDDVLNTDADDASSLATEH